jgi:hypothetical protein
MNQPLRTIIFNCSAAASLIGAALYLTTLPFAAYLFALGSAGIAITHLSTPVKNLDTRRRRLQTFNVIAGLLMVVASVFMFKRQNEWILCLTISAILQLYASFVAGNNNPS